MRSSNIDSAALDAIEYSLVISALGFERRATAVAARLTPRYTNGLALGFDHNHSCSYDENEKWFREHSFVIAPQVKAVDFAASLASHTAPILASWIEEDINVSRSIAIDVSCFDRKRLADIVQWVISLPSSSIVVDFWYCIAEFISPSLTLGRNEVAGPVHRRFAGRFIEPGRPLALVAGLGYEIGRVMGAAEYLQASRIVAFVPESPITQYEQEVFIANTTMLQDLERRQILRYPVADPERTVAMLDSTIRGLEENYNVVLLPGGPKLFALCSFIACTLHRDAAVWRVSSGRSIRPRDVSPSKHFVGLRLHIGPQKKVALARMDDDALMYGKT